jgi:hypothetical protein
MHTNLLILYFFSFSLAGDLKFSVSQKGKTLLCYGGFKYVKEKAMEGKIYWRCVLYTTPLKCHGRVHTQQGQCFPKKNHNHDDSIKKYSNKLQQLRQVQQDVNVYCNRLAA